MRYLPKTISAIPDMETLNPLYSGFLEPSGNAGLSCRPGQYQPCLHASAKSPYNRVGVAIVCCVYLPVRTHRSIHTCIYTYMYICIYIHTHIHIPVVFVDREKGTHTCV